ncbi:hypothetical protein GAY28_14555 [Azospirillum brasilense]|nr:hypothetical protein [Azospirillum brasilense]
MHRIDTATRAPDLFGPGRHGFKDGNPLTGDPPTTLSASMFNHIQEEIARAIEAGGGTLDATKYNQLATALGLGDVTLASPGHLRFGPVVVQWGTGTAGTGGPTIGFEKAFPNACLIVVAGTANGPGYNGYVSAVLPASKTGFTCYASGGNTTASYIAIGF